MRHAQDYHHYKRRQHEENEEDGACANDRDAADIQNREEPNDRQRDAPLRQLAHLRIEEFKK